MEEIRRGRPAGWTWMVEAALAVSWLAAAPAGGAGIDDLLRQGMESFRAGDWASAADRFQEALDDDPASEAARQGLANSLASQGHALLQAGNWTEAKHLAEKATELLPLEARFQILLGIILFRQGDYSYARYAVRRALTLNPDDPAALELSGDLYYQEGSHNLAVPEWEKALERAPEQRSLRQKIDRAQSEEAVEEGLEREVSRHFVMQYDGPVPRDIARTVLRELEEAFERIDGELGSAPLGDITVILYPRMLFHEVTRSPVWVGGRFDGKVRVPVGGLTTEAEVARLRPILAHELTHAFLRSMVPQGLPLWLEEGLAGYFEGLTAAVALERVRSRGREFISLDEVDRSLRGGGDVAAAYAAAALAAHALIDEGGLRALGRILEDVGSGMVLDEALREEARISLPELEEEWRRNLP